MAASFFYILIGLGLLAGGGEVLLRGAVGLAQRLKLTPAVIGLTVVAIGTSVPELAVSAVASYQGKVDLAVANVVGSNILNITLILGLAALITPLAISGSMVRLEYPVMLAVTVLAIFVFNDGIISRPEALLFLLTYTTFTAFLVMIVRKKMTRGELKQIKSEVAEISPGPALAPELPKLLGLLAAGVVLLALGAESTVHGAVEIGKSFGLSERIIGLTIVACGTSLPEIVTSVIAGLRGRDDVAIGNVIGSNLFNILGILGLSALVSPLQVSPEIQTHDSYWMLGTSLLLFPLMRSGMKIEKWEGLVLLGAFFAYLFVIL